MKFFLFSDYHYTPGGYINFGFDGLHKFQRIAEEKGCDMMLHLGDLCHNPIKYIDFIDEYNNFHIPSYNCLGNHDTEQYPREEVIKAYRMPDFHYNLDIGGYRFVIINTSYYRDTQTGEFVPYFRTNYFGQPERETLPPEELEWIKESIESSPYPCILCSHSSFERYYDCKNGHQVRAIIDEANKKKPHSVLMCMNGHMHKDHISIINNVIYYDVTSSTFDCAGCPPMPPHDKFNKEDYENYKNAGYMICPDAPLYSVVTLEGTTVTIEGCEPTTMHCGIGHKELGMEEYDKMGRKYEPFTQSAKITLG
ncbi:MAG: metallophosphoesterase [Clostridia bacterium]|nr:metallophosphoesterase [Clostridia bacterium]